MIQTTILCVDDEIEITKALELYLKRFFIVLTANNPLDAIGIVKSNPQIKIIISDYIMPDLNGCEFLEKVKIINEHIYRIILSGYANDIDIQNHIERNTVHKVITKPWRLKELLLLLQNIEQNLN